MGTYRPEMLGVLADPTRRTIVETLAAGPLSVGELARQLPISRPAVSQHLRALKDAGLVTDQAVGTRRIYRVDPAGLGALRTYLDRLWGQALTAFAASIDASPEHESDTNSDANASSPNPIEERS